MTQHESPAAGLVRNPAVGTTQRRLDYRVGPGRLLLRCLGVLLWRAAEPSTLPVRPAGFVARPAQPTAAATRAVVAIWAAALVVAITGLIAAGHFRRAGAEFLRNPPGLALVSTADRMEDAAAPPWRFLNPPASRKLLLLAGSVRQGQQALERAARAYESAGAQLRNLGPAARIDLARGLAVPLRSALSETPSTWHRETIAYRELEQALAPSLEETAPAGRRLQGRLTAVTPAHALQLCVLASDGRPLEAATRALHPGDAFDLPLPADGWLGLTDLVRKGQGLLEVREEMRLPLREWTEQPIRFPRGGASVQMRFSGGRPRERRHSRD